MVFTQKHISHVVKFLFVVSAIVVLILLLSTPFEKRISHNKSVLVYDTIIINDPRQIRPVVDGKVHAAVYSVNTDFSGLPNEERKIKFIELILPSVLIAKFQLDQERRETIELIRKHTSLDIYSKSDSAILIKLYEKYNTINLLEIPDKQNTHPNSIVLAQAALETGWGQSRFFKKGNNAFGIWSYNNLDNRIDALESRDGQKIYLRKYDGILESVLDYFKTLGRSWAFKDFIEKRAVSENPLELIWYLNMYSEGRYDYVKKLGEIIVENNLIKYDSCVIMQRYYKTVNVNDQAY